MVDVRGDVLRPPHGTTPAAVKSNIKSEINTVRRLSDWLYMTLIVLNVNRLALHDLNSVDWAAKYHMKQTNKQATCALFPN